MPNEMTLYPTLSDLFSIAAEVIFHASEGYDPPRTQGASMRLLTCCGALRHAGESCGGDMAQYPEAIHLLKEYFAPDYLASKIGGTWWPNPLFANGRWEVTEIQDARILALLLLAEITENEIYD